MSAITTDILTAMSHRRAAGERVSALAAELGIPWQKLEKAIRHGPGAAREGAPEPTITPDNSRPGPLTECYRPRRLSAILGQDGVVRFLRQFARSPYPCAFLFEGETGTGKTSAALALAAEVGCDVDKQELGGVWTIASGEQNADAVRDTCESMFRTPFYGSGWKVIIVNEADRMNSAAETIWLDRLENIPQRTVVVFTTNHAARLSQRFLDRCLRLSFGSDADKLLGSTRALLSAVWKAETHRTPSPALIDQIAQAAVQSGKLSFRRAVQLLHPHLMQEGKR
jgi:replication-associated recombination protein RarA